MLPLLMLLAMAKPPARPPHPASTAPERATHEGTYDRLKPSLFTIEVHSGNANAKSTLGSGYLISSDGLVITNYHVVGSYIQDPGRFQLRANSVGGQFVARLVSFDLVNDLALLRVDGVRTAPLPLARRPPQPGGAIVAFGNPEGLGLSLVEGIFNGYAEKGLVDRMLLSMPLNSGMSGGPILNAAGEVIGTNVAVERESNSLSFGVPAAKIAALLERKPLGDDRKSLRDETRRQLALLERETSARLLRDFEAMGDATIAVGGARAARPPAVFECWDNSEQHKEEDVTKSQYSCNLQFTPYVETLGEVAAVHLLVEHFAVGSAAFGFFGWLEQHAQSHNQVEPIAPTNDAFSPPRCTNDRVRLPDVTWKVTSCVSGYVEHEGLFDFDLVATSVSSTKDVMFVSFLASGFRLQPFLSLSRRFLESVRPAGAPK